LGNTLVSLFSYVHGDISAKYMLGVSQGCSLGHGPVFFFWAWMGRTILSPAVLVRTRLTCRLASVAATAGEACFQNPPQGFLYHLDFTYESSTGLLSYAPCILELSPQVGSWVAYHRARRLLPPQVGVLGGVLPIAPVATPSGGGVPLGTGAPSS
jgi:hypothetical protein